MIPHDLMAPLMFGALVVFMLVGYPVAFSLAAVGLSFAFIAVQSGFFEVSLLQGNVSQDLKWRAERVRPTLEIYRLLAESAPGKLIVLPETEEVDLVIDADDLEIDVYRAGGHGGQGVNTTDSAVRITHIPTGIVVSCQNERSQIQNRASAMAVLQSKLLERRRQEEQAKIDALKGDTAGSWGNQMRSYVLHPYQMVKDLRTEQETGNTGAVLDGEIDEFVEAGIRWRKQSAA